MKVYNSRKRTSQEIRTGHIVMVTITYHAVVATRDVSPEFAFDIVRTRVHLETEKSTDGKR